MPKTILESMANMFGRVRRSDLRMYAEQVGQSAFLEVVRCPCLVGMGRFAGEFAERPKDNRVITIPFRQFTPESMAEEREEVGIHESLYPLEVSADQISGVKQFRIGRDSSNDIVIPDYSISSEHANVTYEKRGYHLEDLLSTNGTMVNGVPLFGKGIGLRDGDKLKLGRFQLWMVWPTALYRMLIRPVEHVSPEPPVPVVLEDLLDALGRFDLTCLRQYCRSHDKEAFMHLVEHPVVLMGAGYFPGVDWRRDREEADTVRPLSVDGQDGKKRPLAGSIHPLVKNPLSTEGVDLFVVGRTARADLRMHDPTISKQHARLEFKEDKLTISDLGSANGTSVNAVKLTPFVPRELRVGDRIGFGKNYFVLLAAERLYTSMQEL
ncbi:MAG: FHA domain-containing protein [Magnetococcus sp. DMHC-8]